MSPGDGDGEGRWRALSEEVIVGSEKCPLQRLKATLQEIEAAADQRLAQFRACARQDVALASWATDLSKTLMETRP